MCLVQSCWWCLQKESSALAADPDVSAGESQPAHPAPPAVFPPTSSASGSGWRIPGAPVVSTPPSSAAAEPCSAWMCLVRTSCTLLELSCLCRAAGGSCAGGTDRRRVALPGAAPAPRPLPARRPASPSPAPGASSGNSRSGGLPPTGPSESRLRDPENPPGQAGKEPTFLQTTVQFRTASQNTVLQIVPSWFSRSAPTESLSH